MGLFDCDGEEQHQQESAEALIRSFRSQAPCARCSLSEVNPNNPGFIYRGNLNARIAVLTDSPFTEDVAAKSVFSGPGRNSWDRMLRIIHATDKNKNETLPFRPLREDDFFITFVVQCRTDKDVVIKKRKKGKKTVLSVDPETAAKQDVLTCFNLHTLQVLKSLLNLEVIVAVGKIAVQMILKEDFQYEKHAGNFFISEFFPRVPVFILDNPRAYDIAGEFKMTQLREDLRFFRYKYLETQNILAVHRYYKSCLDQGLPVSLNHQV